MGDSSFGEEGIDGGEQPERYFDPHEEASELSGDDEEYSGASDHYSGGSRRDRARRRKLGERIAELSEEYDTAPAPADRAEDVYGEEGCKTSGQIKRKQRKAERAKNKKESVADPRMRRKPFVPYGTPKAQNSAPTQIQPAPQKKTMNGLIAEYESRMAASDANPEEILTRLRLGLVSNGHYPTVSSTSQNHYVAREEKRLRALRQKPKKKAEEQAKGTVAAVKAEAGAAESAAPKEEEKISVPAGKRPLNKYSHYGCRVKFPDDIHDARIRLKEGYRETPSMEEAAARFNREMNTDLCPGSVFYCLRENPQLSNDLVRMITGQPRNKITCWLSKYELPEPKEKAEKPGKRGGGHWVKPQSGSDKAHGRTGVVLRRNPGTLPKEALRKLLT